MKSPYTGKEMKLEKEPREIVFRKETYIVMFHFWKDDETGQQFTSTALDEINLGQAYNQFRSRHNLPFPDDIQEIRSQYGLSASKMSEILGFGINVYRQYEAGEVPSESNARLIQVARDAQQFKRLVELCGSLDEKLLDKLLPRIDHLIQSQQEAIISPTYETYLVGSPRPDEYSGYRKPNIKRFSAMVTLFSNALNPWKTKLNKLLFYADFVHFSKTCTSISGMRYDAIKMGPVPHNFQGLYQLLAEQQAIEIEYIEYENGSMGERFWPVDTSMDLVAEVLTADELVTIQTVIDHFGALSNQQIIFESHLEQAWKDNVDLIAPGISYLKYAFALRNLDFMA